MVDGSSRPSKLSDWQDLIQGSFHFMSVDGGESKTRVPVLLRGGNPSRALLHPSLHPLQLTSPPFNPARFKLLLSLPDN